jgi:hypothetical protein
VILAVNQVPEDRNARKAVLSLERISAYLKRPVTTAIPSNPLMVNRAINKAVPVIALERDKSKSPIKEFVELANAIYDTLAGPPVAEEEPEADPRKRTSGLRLRLGR